MINDQNEMTKECRALTRVLPTPIETPTVGSRVKVNIAIMRVFVRLRETLALHKELAHKLAELERKIEGHDASIRTLFNAIRELTAPPAKPRGEIGFHIKETTVPYRVKRK